eukprot:16441053-Heterocapsa_arctica.AAC.1
MVMAARQRFGLVIEDVGAPAVAVTISSLPEAGNQPVPVPGIGGGATTEIPSGEQVAGSSSLCDR